MKKRNKKNTSNDLMPVEHTRERVFPNMRQSKQPEIEAKVIVEQSGTRFVAAPLTRTPCWHPPPAPTSAIPWVRVQEAAAAAATAAAAAIHS